MNRTDALQISRRYATATFALADGGEKRTAAVVAEIAVRLPNAIAANAQPCIEALSNPTMHRCAEIASVLEALVAKKADKLTKQAVAVDGPWRPRRSYSDHCGRSGLKKCSRLQLRTRSRRPLPARAHSAAASTETTRCSRSKKRLAKLCNSSCKERPERCLVAVRIELGSLLP